METEADGLLSYDRVLKVEPAIIRAANEAIMQEAAHVFADLGLLEVGHYSTPLDTT